MVAVVEPTSKKVFLIIDGTRHWLSIANIF